MQKKYLMNFAGIRWRGLVNKIILKSLFGYGVLSATVVFVKANALRVRFA